MLIIAVNADTKPKPIQRTSGFIVMAIIVLIELNVFGNIFFIIYRIFLNGKLYLTFSTSFGSIDAMLKIRLQRVGRKNNPAFRVVAVDSKRGPKSGDNVEILGSYNPHFNKIQIKAERVKHWISVGAQVSDTVHNLLINEKIIEGKKINVLPKKNPIKKENEKVDEAPKVEIEAKIEAEESKEDTSPETEAPKEEVKTETPIEEVSKEKVPVETEAPKDEEKKTE